MSIQTLKTIYKYWLIKVKLFQGFFLFFLYIQFTIFKTKRSQSPGTYISKRAWNPSQKAITK